MTKIITPALIKSAIIPQALKYLANLQRDPAIRPNPSLPR
jgi:hypothetical protein